MSKRALITGAGGFIGHHLVKYLKGKGYWVRGVDIKKPEYEDSSSDEFLVLDLRNRTNCDVATKDVAEVYNLAADMGGIGYITAYHADITRNSILSNVNMLESSRDNKVEKFLFSSSACVYPMYMQKEADVTPLKEEDAWPAEPEEGYGLEKLFMEKLCEYYYKDYGFESRIVRFHNVFGPLGTYDGGKEKAPAAICRKIALAEDGSSIEVWGDGEQTRSFMYIDDCVEGIYRISQSEFGDPLNLGTDRLVTINQLVDIIASIAGKKIGKNHDVTQPQGVRGRNSDNNLLREVLNWEPSITLEAGLKQTYFWIEKQVQKNSQ